MRPYPTYTITWITSRSKRPLFACTVTTASAKTKTSSCEMSILYKPITSLVVCQYLTGLSDAYKVIWHHSSGDILHNTHTHNLFFKSLNTSVIQNHPFSQHLLFVSYSAMVQYLAWRVMTGRQREITLNMMVAGHTKFACDRYHGITKHGWDILVVKESMLVFSHSLKIFKIDQKLTCTQNLIQNINIFSSSFFNLTTHLCFNVITLHKILRSMIHQYHIHVSHMGSFPVT